MHAVGRLREQRHQGFRVPGHARLHGHPLTPADASAGRGHTTPRRATRRAEPSRGDARIYTLTSRARRLLRALNGPPALREFHNKRNVRRSRVSLSGSTYLSLSLSLYLGALSQPRAIHPTDRSIVRSLMMARLHRDLLPDSRRGRARLRRRNVRARADELARLRTRPVNEN